MKKVQSVLASFCVFLTAQQGFAQQQPKIDVPETTKTQTPQIDGANPHWYSCVTRPYDPKAIPPVNVSNTTRIESLLRGGKLYLVAAGRDGAGARKQYRYRSRALPVPSCRSRPPSRSGGQFDAGHLHPTSNGATGLNATGMQSFLGNFGGGGGVNGGASPNPNGFDPTINSTLQWGHITLPQQNTITTGTTALVSTNKLANFNIQENFVTGGSATLSYNNTFSSQNAYLNLFNPVTSAFLDLSISQPLLQGFGLAFNNRTIRVAKNNLHAADMVFKQQVIVTVQTVVQAYWLLVSANEDVEVKRKALVLAQKLYQR